MGHIPDTFPDAAFDPPALPGVEAVCVLGGGCFWCTEGVFRQMPGVTDVVAGYAGGRADAANYRAVCAGGTGHVEVVAVHYDPALTSFGKILKTFFWLAHDPTQENGQGNDIGPQYRSVIFTTGKQQHEVAARYIVQLGTADVFDKPIVTAVEQLERFYKAEDEHQNYAARNPAQSYIAAVANPKIEKASAVFDQ